MRVIARAAVECCVTTDLKNWHIRLTVMDCAVILPECVHNDEDVPSAGSTSDKIIPEVDPHLCVVFVESVCVCVDMCSGGCRCV